jgi:uncharacterized membrane protein
MKKDTPIVLAVATYATRDAALHDFETVMSAKTEGEFDHIAAAVLTKDELGNVEVERHDSTAKHAAWGGALLGGALLVAAPVAAPVMIGAGAVGVGASAGVGGGASMAGLAGAGGLAGHFWHNIPKDRTREMADLLDDGESGLLIVAVNKNRSDISPLLPLAQKSIIDDSTKADLESVYDDAISQATS